MSAPDYDEEGEFEQPKGKRKAVGKKKAVAKKKVATKRKAKY